MRTMKVLLALVPLLLTGSPAWADMVHFTAHLSTGAEVPVKSGPGNGTADATLDTASGKLMYTISYSALTGPVTGAHFHGPAGPKDTAGVAVKITGNLASPIKGEAMLTPDQIDALMKGNWYVNLHTAVNTGGEVRGQLMK